MESIISPEFCQRLIGLFQAGITVPKSQTGRGAAHVASIGCKEIDHHLAAHFKRVPNGTRSVPSKYPLNACFNENLAALQDESRAASVITPSLEITSSAKHFQTEAELVSIGLTAMQIPKL